MTLSDLAVKDTEARREGFLDYRSILTNRLRRRYALLQEMIEVNAPAVLMNRQKDSCKSVEAAIAEVDTLKWGKVN